MIISACKRNETIPNTNTLPDQFRFVILHESGNAFSKEDYDQMRISFTKNGTEQLLINTHVTLFEASTSPYQYYYSTRDAAILSGDNGIKTFYIKAGSKVDTVYLDVVKSSDIDPASNGLYMYKEVRFNGKQIQETVALPVPFYLFKQ